MERPWAFWRRVQYGIGLFTLVALVLVGLYYLIGYKEPTCLDGIQNGEERGVDCGGVCERICRLDVTTPAVTWSESFKITDGQYNAVAYVENRNLEVGTPELGYTFKLFDDEGLIVERRGVTVLPPDGVYPIFEGRILTGGRIPTKTTIEFSEDVLWKKGGTGRDQFTVERRELTNADNKPRLTAQLRNNSLTEAKDVEIIATIFDSSRKPLTVARTEVQYFAGRTTEDIVFTWPEPIATNLKSCDIPTDVVLAIDLSGSMNNDGGTPPEPVTSVLSAAKSFTGALGEEDQIGLVTYATGASTTEMLTKDTIRVADVIGNLSIDPKEEQGGTNTGDALLRMQEELTSPRHSENARKVAILLTDGLATAPDEEPELYAQTQAQLLKDTGVLLFTIGLGSSLNEAFLGGLASDATKYYKAPSTRELGAIYESITKSICEDGPTVIEIIAKPGSSFK